MILSDAEFSHTLDPLRTSNPYDDSTLRTVIEDLTNWIGVAPERVYVDKGYSCHNAPKSLRVLPVRSKARRAWTNQTRA